MKILTVLICLFVAIAVFVLWMNDRARGAEYGCIFALAIAIILSQYPFWPQR